MYRRPRHIKTTYFRRSAGADFVDENAPPTLLPEEPESVRNTDSESEQPIDENELEPLYVFDDAPVIIDGLKGIIKYDQGPRNIDRKIHFSRETIHQSELNQRRRIERIVNIHAGNNDSPVVNQTDFHDEDYPKFGIVPFKDRRQRTDLEVHAGSLIYVFYLTAAVNSQEPQQQMNNFLQFMNFFSGNLDYFVQKRKPLRSFVGETYDVDKPSHEIKALLEQVQTDTVAMHVIGDQWTLTMNITTHPKGDGFIGGGSFTIGMDEEIGFTFRANFVQTHYSEAENEYIWFQEGVVTASCAVSGCIGKLSYNDNDDRVFAKSFDPKHTTRYLFRGTEIGGKVTLFRHEMLEDGAIDRRIVTTINPIGRVMHKRFRAELQDQAVDNLPKTDARNRVDILNGAKENYDAAEDWYMKQCYRNYQREKSFPRYFVRRNVKERQFYEFREGRWGLSYFDLKDMKFGLVGRKRRNTNRM